MTVRPLDPAVIATDRGADRPTSAEDILDLLDALRPAWHADAACRGQTDGDVPRRRARPPARHHRRPCPL